jgi:hypothetical protein
MAVPGRRDGERRFSLRHRVAVGVLALGLGSPLCAANPAPSYAMDDGFRQSLAAISQSLSAGDAAGALGRARSLAPRAQQPLEKFSLGEVLLQAGAVRSDLQSQRIALNLILESGLEVAARKPQRHATAGILSAMLGDFRDSVAQIRYANQLGYQTVPSQVALAEASFQTGDATAGNQALEQAASLAAQDKRGVDPAWYDRAIALSFQRKRTDIATQWTQRKLVAYPTAQHWRSGAVNLMTGAGLGVDQTLDLWRLLRKAGALATERDWQAHAIAAQQAGYAAEAKAIIAAAIAQGVMGPTDPAAKLPVVAASKAKKPTAKGKAAAAPAAPLAADLSLSSGNFAAAILGYRSALAKPGADMARLNTRLGIALALSGDMTGGKAALAQVPEGPWAPVAALWTSWIDSAGARPTL